MYPSKYKIFLLLFIATFTYSCLEESGDTENLKVKRSENIKVPIFNSDSAYKFVEKQVSFGPRVISSSGWENCSIWIKKKLRSFTKEVIFQEAPVTTYDGKNHILKNIIASFNPEKKNRIAFFAHWDSRHIADQDSKDQEMPILGANDGGSGVGVLIEIARQLHIKSPKIGVDIILFDAEDYGDPNQGISSESSWCLGSQYWSKNTHIENYTARYGILLDMVGAKDATFYMELFSVKNQRQLAGHSCAMDQVNPKCYFLDAFNTPNLHGVYTEFRVFTPNIRCFTPCKTRFLGQLSGYYPISWL